ncbi:hypothetical protein Bca4012_027080 [Brassica carinata]
MSDYGDGNFMDMVSHWAAPPSPISDVFLQTNQSEKRSGLVDRVAARVGRKIPPLRIGNPSQFNLFRKPKTVPFSIEISPGLNQSVLLQSPSQLISPFSFSDDGLPEMVENPGDNHANTTMIFNNNVPHQPMHFDLPPQEDSFAIPIHNSAYIQCHVDLVGSPLVDSFESGVADETDIIKLVSLDDESKSEEEDDEYSQDEDTYTDEDDDNADELVVKPSSPKRRKYEVSNMMTARKTSKDPRVILRMETEEDHPDDGYRWRKYGQKIVHGNPNPRSYYKCSHKGCNVKKQVERGADDVKILVTTYDGIHGHTAPATRSSSSSGSKKRSGSSVPDRLGRPPFSSFSAAQDVRPFPYPSTWAPQDMRRPFPYSSASATQDMRPLPSSLNPGVDMTHLYMKGLSKLPTLRVNQNHGCTGQNDEPRVINQNQGLMGQNYELKTDHVIPEGPEVYKGIIERLLANCGVKVILIPATAKSDQFQASPQAPVGLVPGETSSGALDGVGSLPGRDVESSPRKSSISMYI